ncbi:MAG TPA: hypothetical protein VIV60_03585 [Polyangiaceae bacterium]
MGELGALAQQVNGAVRGIQGSNTDLLICATARRRKLSIYTTDADFRHYAKVLKLELHEPRD